MKRIWLAAVAAVMMLAAPAWAQQIVDVAYVKAALARGALLWDARDEGSFAKGHIPGAVNIGAPTDELRDPNTEDYLPLPQLEKILGAAALDPQREVIVYAQRGASSAYFAQFTLRYFGATKAYVFHDGIDGWRAAGEKIATEPTAPKPVALKLVPTAGLTVDTKAVIASVRNPNVQIVDARTPKEFKGEDIRAIRGGHIPGAINIPYEQNWLDPDAIGKMRRGQLKDSSGMQLKPRDELRKLYAALDPNKETIVYCQSGVRAAETAAVLSDLGFSKVKLYDSSWLGYAAALSAPAEDEVFVNVGALNNQIRALESRLNALEAALQKR
jgi:thiosulfate/3-mercaptopyruvate sulfurtransferase